MKPLMLAALLFAPSDAPAQTASTAPAAFPFLITYPPEGFVMGMNPGIRVAGSADPRGLVRINGKTVKPHSGGGFLGYVPVSAGTNAIRVEAEFGTGDTAAITRTITVLPPAAPLPLDSAMIDPDSVSPRDDLEVRAGDWITVSMKATPGGQAEFQIKGVRKALPMLEVDPVLGIYRGSYQAQPGDESEAAEVRVSIKTNEGREKASAKGRVTIRRDSPPVAIVRSTGTVNVRSGPSTGFIMFPPANTRFLVVGRQGSELKLQLNSRLSGWASASALQLLPSGAPPPRATLGTIRTQLTPDSTIVYFNLNQVIPFMTEPSEDLKSLTVRFFYTTSYTNWMIYDSTDTYVRDVRWTQEETDTVAATIVLNRKLWGFQTSWEGGLLKVELRHPPKIGAQGSVLKDRVIILDPGHMPSAPGATGVKGTLEKDVNLATAKALEVLLTQEGAKPVMTRAGDEEVGLVDRPRIAADQRGELFISIHNNNLPDGINPFDSPHGFSIFYYHPQSFDFARAMHRSYVRNIRLPDEGLRYGNLLVARTTEMPSILLESAYMTFPDQEELLLSPEFQKKLARTIAEGIRDFLEPYRQSGSPAAAPKSREKKR